MRLFNQWVEPAKDGTFTWHLNVMDDGLADEMPTCGEGDEWMLTHVSTAAHGIVRGTRRYLDTGLYEAVLYVGNAGRQDPDDIYHNYAQIARGVCRVSPSVELIAGNLRKRIVTMDRVGARGRRGNPADHEQDDHGALQTAVFRFCVGGNGFTDTTGLLSWLCAADALVRLANALYAFAPYCGVGIKTALGMGGCSVELL